VETASHRYILNAIRRTPNRIPLRQWEKIESLIIPDFARIVTQQIYLKLGETNPRIYDLDHIYPLSAFSKCLREEVLTVEEFLSVFHPDNYQWLLHKTNLRKSATHNKIEFLAWTKSKANWVNATLLK